MRHKPELWELLDRLRRDAAAAVDVEAALKRVKRRFQDPKVTALRPRTSIPERSDRRWRRTSIAAAAAVAIVAGGVLFWRIAQRGGEPPFANAATVYKTAIGRTDTLRLPDGTRVVLAPSSRLVLARNYGRRARLVQLSGQALFDVVHEAARPFSVSAGAATIRDIGTSFAVRNIAGENIEVAVTEGTVVLHASGTDEWAGVVLHAGALGVLDGGGLTTVHPAIVTDADTAFVSGRLVFREADLSEVAVELRRWYGVVLRVEDPALARRHITASFRGEPVQQVLAVIALALGARIELNGDTAIVRAQR
ncbi:MAG: FecR family protein [Gemmatimonadota bacterium]